MTTLTITARGQITLTPEMLQHLGLRPGDSVEVTCAPGGHLILAPKPIARNGRIDDIIGALHRPGQKALSIEEMNEAIARAWAGEIEP